MNYKQYLLIKMAEECNEIAQMAIKCALFGGASTDPRELNGESNEFKLFKELMDFTAVMEEMESQDNPKFDDFDYEEYIDMKQEKLQYYFTVAAKNNYEVALKEFTSKLNKE